MITVVGLSSQDGKGFWIWDDKSNHWESSNMDKWTTANHTGHERISRTDIDYRIYGLQLPASDMWTHTHSSMGVQRANTSICTGGLKISGLTQNLCLTHVLRSGLKRRVYHPIPWDPVSISRMVDQYNTPLIHVIALHALTETVCSYNRNSMWQLFKSNKETSSTKIYWWPEVFCDWETTISAEDCKTMAKFRNKRKQQQ